MRYFRTLIPSVCLLCGAAAAQAPKPEPLPKPQPPVASPSSDRISDAERALIKAQQQLKEFSVQDLAYGDLTRDVQVQKLDAERALAQAREQLEELRHQDFGKLVPDLEMQMAQLKSGMDAMGFKDAAKDYAAEQKLFAADIKRFGSSNGLAMAPQKFGPGQSEDRLYDTGQRALDARRWDEALEAFTQAASKGGGRADGAWFWKAYTLRKLGRRDDALAAIAELRKSFPNSRWLDDAKALELEVRQASGQAVAPESESDDELKLMALNGLMRSDPERAFPILENLLKSAQSPRLKKNAVFVLAQSDSPKAAQLLEQVARGQGNPDLQVTAIRYMGEKRRDAGQAQILGEIYSASSDNNVKRAVMSSLAARRDKERLLQIAKVEKSQELRLEAIRYLASNKDAQAELWQLYQSETAPEIRQQILRNLPAATNADKLAEIARTEKDATLRRSAILSLANRSAAGSSDVLVGIYGSEQDPAVKRSIIDALFSQGNAKSLVQLARSERDFKMKQAMVERLSSMKAPEATEYLMEILK